MVCILSKLFRIADYIVYKCTVENNWGITSLKLQKLLYFVQAYYINKKGKTLFDDDFEAWVHGPVNVYVYKNYVIKPSNLTMEQICKDMDVYESNIIDEALAVFGELTGGLLVSLSHNEKPWIEAREGLKSWERSQNKITRERMLDYYKHN